MIPTWRDTAKLIITYKYSLLFPTMVRYRPRAQVLKALKEIRNQRKQQKLIRDTILGLDDEFSSSDDESCSSTEKFVEEGVLLLEDLIDQQLLQVEQFIESKRYLFREPYRDRSFVFDLADVISNESKRFNEEDFRKEFRVSRSSFHWLCDLFSKSPHLLSQGNKEIFSIEFHLLLFLRKVGSEGVEASDTKMANFFGIGKGSVSILFNRMKQAILSFKRDVIKWPTEQEKNAMKLEIKTRYGFQKCVGIIDGTIIILNQRPQKFGDSYWCRKCVYSLNVQVVCDHNCNILYYYGGWPGSVHDNRAWKNCKLYKSASTYFSQGEYLVGDCAYSACNVMVQTFKKLPGISNLCARKEFFNTKLGSLRVKSEHCIGILKNRFPMLRRTNASIKDQADVMKVMETFGSCAVLHNLLLQVNEPIPQEWYEEIDAGHYWTSDYDGSDNGNDIESDRRDLIYYAYINDYYIN